MLEHVTSLQGGSEKAVTGIVVSECGAGLVSAGMDGALQLWSLSEEAQGLGTTTRSAQSWRRTLIQPVGGGEINSLALLSSTVACGCQDGSVRLFRLLKEQGAFMLYSLLRRQHSVVPAAPAPGIGGAAAMRPNGGAVDGFGGGGKPSEVMCVALSTASWARSAPLLASGAQDGSVCLWESSSGRLLQRLEAHTPDGSGWVMALVLSRHTDGRSGLLLTASYDRTIKVWVRPGDECTGANGSPRSSFIGGASASASGGACGAFGNLQGASNGGGGGSGVGAGGWALACTLAGHTDGVLGLELSRSRRHAFSGGNDHTVRVWELQSGSCLQVLTQHVSSVSALGWHLSSGCLATGAEDGLVLLWDVSALDEAGTASAGGQAGEQAASPCSLAQTVRIEHSEVLCIATSLDGTALLCGLDDGSMALLAAASGIAAHEQGAP